MSQAQHQPQPQSTALTHIGQLARIARAPVAPARDDWPDLYVPGWPARGRFNDWDRMKIAIALPRLMACAIELVFECHFCFDSPFQARPDRLRCLAFDMLEFLHGGLKDVVDARATPIFRVAHAALLERGFDLSRSPESVGRELRRYIIARQAH